MESSKGPDLVIWSSFETEDGPPPTYELITAAIIQEYVPIVVYLLSMHPEGNIGCDQIVRTIIDYPNIEILKFLQSHTPSIVNFEFNPLQTFLTEACRGDWQYGSPASDKTLPLIHYLLDNGADPKEGSWNGYGALYSALGTMNKMIHKGAVVGILVFDEAIRKQRLDSLQLFFEKATFSLPIEEMLEQARNSGSKEIMSLVKAGAAELKKRKQPKWWQFWK